MSRILFILITVIAFHPMSAQDKHQTAVASAVEEMRKAMIDADQSRLENLVSDQLSYGHSSGVIDDKKTFVEKIVTGKSDFVSIDLSEQTITVTDKTAIVRHLFKAKTNDGGKPGEVQLRILLVWQKEKRSWKLLARQAVRI